MMRKNITTGFGGLFVMLGALLAFTPERVHAQFVLYDNFNDEVLSAEKWIAQLSGSGIELVRWIVTGELHMAHRVVGNTTTNTGFNQSINRIRFPDAEDPIGVRFKMRVLNASARGCPDGTGSRTYAGLTGSLFRDTEGGIMGVYLFAERRSDSTPEDVLRIHAGLYHCLGQTCPDLSPLDLGPLPLNENVTLQMVWQKDKKQVRFRRRGDPVQVAKYTQSVAQELRGSKQLLIRGDAANCTAGDQPLTSMSVIFDNVFTMQ
jgi:hypothetical protein